MEFSAILAQFGDAIGMSGLSLDADGSCTLLFDDAHEITFTCDAADHAVLLYSEVGKASDLREKSEAMRLLSASLLGAQTGGAAFAVHEAMDAVILWKRYDDRFQDVADIEKAVNDFLPQVEEWKGRLQEHTGESTPSSGDNVMPTGFGLFV